MKTCYMYSFITPYDPSLRDNDTIPPLGVVPVVLKSRSTGECRNLEAAIIGTSNTIKAFRFTIPDTENDTIASEDWERFFKYRKLMLDCIRLTYDPCTEYARPRGDDDIMTIWHFRAPGEGPSLDLKIDHPIDPEYRVNVDAIKHFFAIPEEQRPIIHLLADSGDFRTSIHFRFLSLYKIVEMHYKITANKRFNAFIEPLLPIFQKVYPEITTIPAACSLLTGLRDRCAHIMVGLGSLGFSHFDADNAELFKAMPVIRQIAVACANANYPNSPLRLSVTPEGVAEQIAEMERRGLDPKRLL